MKAERRHELETNSLALWLRFRAPELAQQHGSKILLGIVVLALGVVLVRNRMQAPRRAAAEAANYVANARQQIEELRMTALLPDEFRSRGRLPSDTGVIVTQIRTALERSDDPVIQADANLALGDYYWALVNWPDLPAAATQPQLKPAEPRDVLLSKAEEAYKRVVATPNVKPHLLAAARFGLAAIEETRGFELDRQNLEQKANTPNPHWAAAREHYQAIVNAANVPSVLKDEAQAKLSALPQLQEPIWLVPATRPATSQPTTQSSVTTPTTQQSTTAPVPTLSTPASSTTRPTTRPAS